jgi:hypothetical protein
MDHTPRPHEMATLLNNHARQTELAIRRTNIMHFASNGIVKPAPFPPHRLAIDPSVASNSQSPKATNNRQRAKPLTVCSQCGRRSFTYRGAFDFFNQACPGCQSLSQSPDQPLMDPILEVQSSGGTDGADGDYIESQSKLSRDQEQVPSNDHVLEQEEYHSWVAPHNPSSSPAPLSDCNSVISNVMADEDVAESEQLSPKTPTFAAARMHPNNSSDTLDLAFFLRTTGPPPPSSDEGQREQKKSRNWVALSKFRKRQGSSQSDEKSVIISTSIQLHFTETDTNARELIVSTQSNSKVIQRISKDGEIRHQTSLDFD